MNEEETKRVGISLPKSLWNRLHLHIAARCIAGHQTNKTRFIETAIEEKLNREQKQKKGQREETF